MLTVVLHLGTLLAVFIMFRRIIWDMVKEFIRVIADIFRFRNITKDMNDSRRMLFMVFIATIPLIGAYFLKDIVEIISSDNDIIVEGICFFITGLLLYTAFFRERGYKAISDMKFYDALIIGITQMIAVTPGISRSGSTTSVGALRGFKKETVVTFSFILGIPAIFAAVASEFISTSPQEISFDIPMLIIGFGVSLAFGIITIALIRWLIKKERYIVFAYYLLIIGIVTISLGLLERFL